MPSIEPRAIEIEDYDSSWPTRFSTIAASLRDRVGDDALRIDHIGSTAVPGLSAKDVIDIQITLERLEDADVWPDELLDGLTRRREIADDHIPPGSRGEPGDWTKCYWSQSPGVHVHVREMGRLNQRYALLFRDYLRADPVTAAAYGQLKRALAAIARDDVDMYYAVKDPACDLIIAGAEQWALRVGWVLAPSDA